MEVFEKKPSKNKNKNKKKNLVLTRWRLNVRKCQNPHFDTLLYTKTFQNHEIKLESIEPNSKKAIFLNHEALPKAVEERDSLTRATGTYLWRFLK